MKIYYWADGCSCVDEDFESMLSWRSDDYGILDLPDDNGYEDFQIDVMVDELVSI